MHHPTDRIASVTAVEEHWLEQVIAQWVHHEESIRRPIAPWVNVLTTELHLTPGKEESVLLNNTITHNEETHCHELILGLLFSISTKGSFICIIPQPLIHGALAWMKNRSMGSPGGTLFDNCDCKIFIFSSQDTNVCVSIVKEMFLTLLQLYFV